MLKKTNPAKAVKSGLYPIHAAVTMWTLADAMLIRAGAVYPAAVADR